MYPVNRIEILYRTQGGSVCNIIDLTLKQNKNCNVKCNIELYLNRSIIYAKYPILILSLFKECNETVTQIIIKVKYHPYMQTNVLPYKRHVCV